MASSYLSLHTSDVAHLFRYALEWDTRSIGPISPAGLQATRAKLVGDGVLFASGRDLYFGSNFTAAGEAYRKEMELPSSSDSFTSPPMSLKEGLTCLKVGDSPMSSGEIQSVAARYFRKGFIFCKAYSSGEVHLGYADTSSSSSKAGLEVAWAVTGIVPEVRCEGWCGVDIELVSHPAGIAVLVAAIHVNSSRAVAGAIVPSQVGTSVEDSTILSPEVSLQWTCTLPALTSGDGVQWATGSAAPLQETLGSARSMSVKVPPVLSLPVLCLLDGGLVHSFNASEMYSGWDHETSMEGQEETSATRGRAGADSESGTGPLHSSDGFLPLRSPFATGGPAKPAGPVTSLEEPEPLPFLLPRVSTDVRSSSAKSGACSALDSRAIVSVGSSVLAGGASNTVQCVAHGSDPFSDGDATAGRAAGRCLVPVKHDVMGLAAAVLSRSDPAVAPVAIVYAAGGDYEVVSSVVRLGAAKSSKISGKGGKSKRAGKKAEAAASASGGSTGGASSAGDAVESEGRKAVGSGPPGGLRGRLTLKQVSGFRVDARIIGIDAIGSPESTEGVTLAVVTEAGTLYHVKHAERMIPSWLQDEA